MHTISVLCIPDSDFSCRVNPFCCKSCKELAQIVCEYNRYQGISFWNIYLGQEREMAPSPSKILKARWRLLILKLEDPSWFSISFWHCYMPIHHYTAITTVSCAMTQCQFIYEFIWITGSAVMRVRFIQLSYGLNFSLNLRISLENFHCYSVSVQNSSFIQMSFWCSKRKNPTLSNIMNANQKDLWGASLYSLRQI